MGKTLICNPQAHAPYLYIMIHHVMTRDNGGRAVYMAYWGEANGKDPKT